MNENKSADRNQSHATDGWQAHLSLGFTKDPKRTIMKHRRHSGPLRVQRPFYPETQYQKNNDTCHVYLLHPPGGIVGGDSLDINIKVEAKTDTLITTPAANKFYRSNNQLAVQSNTLQIEDNASFEWLPQETIVFDGACVKSKTMIKLADTANFIGWDIICLGRPASQEKYLHGYFKQHIEVWREEKPLLIDRCHHQGNSEALTAKWGMANFPVSGLLFATMSSSRSNKKSASVDLINKLRQTITANTNCLFSITMVNDMIICRYLGEQIEQAKTLFIQSWLLLRPALLNKEAVIPRIWNT